MQANPDNRMKPQAHTYMYMHNNIHVDESIIKCSEICLSIGLAFTFNWVKKWQNYFGNIELEQN